MASDFVFNENYKILLCRACNTALPPSQPAQERHLRLPRHGFKGAELAALLQLFQAYGDLRSQDLPAPDHAIPQAPIPHLRCINGYSCRHCTKPSFTKSLRRLRTHIFKEHNITHTHQTSTNDYRPSHAQTIYSEKQFIRYFEVLPPTDAEPDSSSDLPDNIQGFFTSLAVKREAQQKHKLEAAGSVAGFDAHKSEVVPWLQRTGIANHLYGLPFHKMETSFKLPNSIDNVEPLLQLVLDATDRILDLAYELAQPGRHTEMHYSTRMVMAQFSPMGSRDGAAHTFLPTKRPSTLKRYFRLWKQFVVYYFNRGFDDEESNFWFPSDNQPDDVDIPKIEVSGQELDGMVTISRAQNEQSSEQAFASTLKVLPVIFRFAIGHKPGADVFTSALVSYAAMLAVKPTTRTWKEPGDFNSNLSGLIWVSQLLLFYFCAIVSRESLDEEGERMKSTHEKVRTLFDDIGRQHSDTALGHLLGWRDLLFSVSKTTMVIREAIWNQDQTELTYDGTLLNIRDVTRIIASEFKRAQETMDNDLLLGAKGLMRVEAVDLKDNVRHIAVGESLLDVCASHIPTYKLESIIQHSSHYRRHFIQQTAEGTVKWNEKAIDLYEANVQRFLQHLLTLVHIGSGQPLRSPEILSTRWQNTQNQARSVFVLNGRVMIRINYHKGLQHTGKTKDNMRFLPISIGQLLLDFLIYVQPLRQEFLQQVCPAQTPSPFIWERGLEVWGDERLTTCLEKACKRAEAPRLHVSNWRQFTVAIVKAKFAANLHCFDVDPGEDQEDRDDANPDVQAMNLQRNHATATANLSYANQHSFGGITDELVQRSFRASMLWSELFSIESTLQKISKRTHLQSISSDEEDTGALKRMRAGQHRVQQTYTHRELLAAARKAYKNPTLVWRSHYQLMGLVTVMSGEPAIVAVLSTGAGKSLLFMLPCTLPEARTTILVLPLVSLRTDMLRRLKTLGIRTALWSAASYPSETVVIVSAEAAISGAFLSYAQSLISKQSLDRIVIDECHLTITASDYRKSMSKLGQIRTLRAQFVYLTATLPPSMQSQFITKNFLAGARIVRGPTDRPNLVYRQLMTPGKIAFLEECAEIIRYYHQKHGQMMQRANGMKALIYCQTIDSADKLSSILNCSAYTSQAGNVQEKENIISEWLDMPERNFLVATSALSAGFDYPHIRHVWHVDVPSTMVDYVQEAGRGGRDGELAYSYIIRRKQWKPATDHHTPIEKFITTTNCLRKALSQYFDTPEHVISQCKRDIYRCTNCLRVPQHSSVPATVQHVETPVDEMTLFNGAQQIQLRAREEEDMSSHFEHDLQILKGTCCTCRHKGKNFEHAFNECKYRFQFLKAKKLLLEKSTRPWLEDYTACFRCYLPQIMCDNLASQETECEFRDIVMPWCFTLWQLTPGVIHKYSGDGNEVVDGVTLLSWLGRPDTFGGSPCIRAVPFMAAQLRMNPLY